ncbi:MAG: BspA family leucine-rich repeat surface protein, partial [Hyphomicrobiales bacterium]
MNRNIFTIIYTLVLFNIVPTELFAAEDELDGTSFITVWKTDNLSGKPESKESNATSITIPTNSDFTYNYDIDFGNDGDFEVKGVTGDYTHDFGEAGTYTIRIRGEFPGLYFFYNDFEDPKKDIYKLMDVKQWGNISFKTFESAFFNCKNIQFTATDTPDLSNVTNMKRAFESAKNFNSDISSWDVSKVTNFRDMFKRASSFNCDLNSWNMSSAVDLGCMFFYATNFNGNVSSWNVSNVKIMYCLFYEARNFNCDLSLWDVSNVESMNGLFAYTNFNRDISMWDVSNVTNMARMFSSARKFNCDLSSWDVSKVADFRSFIYTDSFSVENYSKMLAAWGQLDKLVRDIKFDVTAKYIGADAIAGRDRMINEFGWDLSDRGAYPNTAPSIASGQSFEVFENADINKVIGTVNVIDNDPMTTLSSYTIATGNEDGVFGINADNGELFVADNSKLNYDDANQYTLGITVSDGVNTSEEGTVIVNITDFNYPVVITSGQSFDIAENANNNDVVGIVAATDKDSNTTLSSYVIASGNEDGVFGINADNGELFVADNTKLNYDDANQYTLGITVSDGVDTSEEGTVIVNVVDFSYKPVITSDQNFEIVENANNNDVVGSVAATDKDSNTNLSSYIIATGNEDGVFGINADNGELFVADNSKLNYDDANQYTLGITV